MSLQSGRRRPAGEARRWATVWPAPVGYWCSGSALRYGCLAGSRDPGSGKWPFRSAGGRVTWPLTPAAPESVGAPVVLPGPGRRRRERFDLGVTGPPAGTSCFSGGLLIARCSTSPPTRRAPTRGKPPQHARLLGAGVRRSHCPGAGSRDRAPGERRRVSSRPSSLVASTSQGRPRGGSEDGSPTTWDVPRAAVHQARPPGAQVPPAAGGASPPT